MPTQPLAPGEVLLEVNAAGVDVRQAEAAVLSFVVASRGDDGAEARRMHAMAIGRVRAQARAAGVAAEDVQVTAPHVEQAISFDVVTPPPPEHGEAVLDEPPFASSGGSRRAIEVARSNVTIRLRDIDAAAVLRDRLTDEAEMGIRVRHVLDDRRDARRSARASALATARADAETYAASVRMRIVRVVRVSERLGWEATALGFTEYWLYDSFLRYLMGESREVTTLATVGVDFALAPQ